MTEESPRASKSTPKYGRITSKHVDLSKNITNIEDSRFIPLTTQPIGLNIPCTPCKLPDVVLKEDGFGMYPPFDGTEQKPIKQYTWCNRNRISITVMNYGATITRVSVPNRKGIPDNIVMGFDTLEGYHDETNPGFGGLIGRYCNRIYKSTFQLDGKVYNLKPNSDINNQESDLGFHKAVWNSEICGTKVVMTHLSRDGEEGFPGNVLVSVTFQLSSDNKFVIEINATSTFPTPINLTYNNYFNLAGHAAGDVELLKHWVIVNADSFTPVNKDGYVTGQIRSVSNKKIDLQVPTKLENVISFIPGGGFNHTYCINRGVHQDLTFATRLLHSNTGRVVEMYTNQPCVQFYTGNDLPGENKDLEDEAFDEQSEGDVCHAGDYPCPRLGFDCNDGQPCLWNLKEKPCCFDTSCKCKLDNKDTCKSQEEKSPCCACEEYVFNEEDNDHGEGDICEPLSFMEDVSLGPIRGINNSYYRKHGALCMNSQNYPDAVNHDNFPNSILRPGEVYKHKIVYKFWLLKSPRP